MDTQKQYRRICCFLLLGSLFSKTAYADLADMPMDDFFELSPEELANIPINIATGSASPATRAAGVATIITADTIEAMGATQLHEILETVPSLHVSLNTQTYDYIYTIRGIRNANGSQALLLINGARNSVPSLGGRVTAFRVPVEHIQRIEIIRGPGSAIYGADAFAGVINIVTKKGSDIAGTTAGGRAGNFNTQSGWLQHGGKYADWNISGSFQYQHTDGDKRRRIESDLQTILDQQFNTQASTALGSFHNGYKSWTANLGIQRKHIDLHFNAWHQTHAGTGAGAASALDGNGFLNSKNYLTDLKLSTEDWFDKFELQANFSYLYTDFQSDLTVLPKNTLLPIGSDGNLNFVTPTGITAFPDGFIGNPGREQHIPSVELVGLYEGIENHRFRIAGGYRYEKIKTNETKNFGPGILDGTQAIVDGSLTQVTGTPFVYLKDRDRSIWSFSLQDEWAFADDWLLTAGVRYDHYSDFGDTVNPRFALVWSVTDQFTSKLLYGRAFRAPSFSEQGNINNPVLLGNDDLDPEIIHTVELAFNYIPTSDLSTALNLYGYTIADLIQPVNDVGATTVTIQNASDQKGYGLEFEWDWKINQQVVFNGNYAWQRAVNESTGKRVADVPEHQVYGALAWNFLPHWLIQQQVSWIGGRERAKGDNRSDLKDYAMFDMTLQRKNLFQHIDLTASMRNILDNNKAREPGSAALANDLPLPGRNFYLEVKAHF